MKHLLLLGTGGTIACKRGENGLTPLLTGDELLSYVPDAKKFCEVETVQVLNIDSTNMHPKHWLKLAQVLEFPNPILERSFMTWRRPLERRS